MTPRRIEAHNGLEPLGSVPLRMTASLRFEFRLRSDVTQRIERAAELSHESASDFARKAVEEGAEKVLREDSATTRVPAQFFDDLLAALDAAATPNAALARAAKRAQSDSGKPD